MNRQVKARRFISERGGGIACPGGPGAGVRWTPAASTYIVEHMFP